MTERLAQERAASLVREVTEQLGHAGPVTLGIVPHITRGLAPRPQERERSFLAHLDAILDDSFGPEDSIDSIDSRMPAPVDPETQSERAENLPGDPNWLTAACIACRGHCCIQGAASFAFLTRDTVDHVRRDHPEASRDSVRAAYVSHLPGRSVEGSCLYHGSRGCTLPRAMRADICNSWDCRWRSQLRSTRARQPDAPVVVVGMPRDQHEHAGADSLPISVVSVDAAARIRTHPELKLPPLPEGLVEPDGE